ncbi:NAD-dependent protein deacetylase hst4 [Neolecta irregularis DAH-3]|uniref:NAD-dependent protein deacetylase hst4 n=1 Tax=Neolecta irregularis (strain DAH-3) TaxID=1198029 RepID=A0A1U7LTF0_NEOID|nr:NAD-dependent protein deacetylase hst4 [Neolecta irregularis DAH-3]|eukprot:OLL25822.1 NAD-dependent protein deacetylase hst4 [Neolecta irregularis DAH-3]
MPPKRKRNEISSSQPSISFGPPYQFLDLSKQNIPPEAVSIFKRVVTKAKRIVVITGAGVSVASGIPDFRSSTGLFASLRQELKISSGKDMFDASVYSSPESASQFHRMVSSLHSLCKSAQPTPFHTYLSELGESGRLLRLYTQNIDCLEDRLPGLSTNVPLTKAWPKTVRLHGGLDSVICHKCSSIHEFSEGMFEGEEIPDCERCSETEEARSAAGKRRVGIGKVRPRVVLYNEWNPDAEAIGKITESDLRARPDALLVVGTTLKIPGVQRMVKEFAASVHCSKGRVIWINPENPPKVKGDSDLWDIVVKGDCQAAIEILKATPLPREKFANITGGKTNGPAMSICCDVGLKEPKVNSFSMTKTKESKFTTRAPKAPSKTKKKIRTIINPIKDCFQVSKPKTPPAKKSKLSYSAAQENRGYYIDLSSDASYV